MSPNSFESRVSAPPTYMRTGLPGVTCFEEVDSSHEYRVWHEDWYCFCLVSKGQGDIRYRSRTLQLTAGHAFAFSPGEVHETRRIHAPGTYRVLMVPAADVNTRVGRVTIDNAVLGFGECHPIFAALVDLTDAFARPRTSDLEREAYYTRLLDAVTAPSGSTPRHTNGNEDPRVVRDVRDFLLTHTDLNLKLTDVASALGWSHGYVSRVFSAHGYCPPKTLLRFLRVERARRMLVADPTRSIKNAALSAGFNSVEKFNIAFRAAWNMTPSQYLTTYRKVDATVAAQQA